MQEMSGLETGDIGASKGSAWILKFMNFIMAPSTDRFHHFILWYPIKGFGLVNDDWVILESIPSHGIAVGRLSWHETEDVEFYRVVCDDDLRTAAPTALVDYGRSTYDYLLPVKLALQLPRILFNMLSKEHTLRKLKALDFHYNMAGGTLLCTEAVEKAYLCVGVSIVPTGELPAPSSFKEAEIEGRIYEVGKLSKGYFVAV